jgi:phospholipase C
MAALMIGGLADEARGVDAEDIDTIVVIYAENRTFDCLYGFFPGVNELSQINAAGYTQLDRDGSILGNCPQCGVADGQGVIPVGTQARGSRP